MEAIGYGFVIHIFFVTSGLQFDLPALFGSPSTVLRLPLLLVALLAVRGLPAIVYRGDACRSRLHAAGLLQATSLPFIVAASAIGTALGLISPATATALVGACLLPVVLFPSIAVILLREAETGAPLAPVLQSAQVVSGGGTDE